MNEFDKTQKIKSEYLDTQSALYCLIDEKLSEHLNTTSALLGLHIDWLARLIQKLDTSGA